MFNKMKWLTILFVVVAFTACSGSGGGLSLNGGNPSKVLATVNGAKITEKDVMTAIEPQLKKVESELYKMEKAGLDQLVQQKLLEEAAKKEGKSVDAFMAAYLAQNSKEPTEDEIKKYYEFRKEQLGGKTYDDVKKQIGDFLKQNQVNSLNRQLITSLMASAEIKINLEPPRINIDIGNSPTKGPKDAPVTIVEFTDYQCPFCKRARPIINQILEAYPDKVLYVLKDFPLSFHQHAQKAHEAAHCAGEQGKYWEMFELIFKNQNAITVDDLKRNAKEVGLDTAKFDKCLDESAHLGTVTKNLQEGQSAGVTGTPAFFVNGILISGARPFADFKELIDSELNRK